MAHGATNEKLRRERKVWCFVFYSPLTLADDPDNVNLSSPYHYPSRKNTYLALCCHGLIGGRKKELLLILVGISTQVYR
jgi:hypothetical protein